MGNYHRDVAISLFNLANLEKDVDNFDGMVTNLLECLDVLEVGLTLA